MRASAKGGGTTIRVPNSSRRYKKSCPLHLDCDLLWDCCDKNKREGEEHQQTRQQQQHHHQHSMQIKLSSMLEIKRAHLTNDMPTIDMKSLQFQ